MTPLLLSAYTATTCLGRGLDATRQALRNGRSGLVPCAFETVQLNKFGGILKSHDPSDPYYQRTHSSDALTYMVVMREPVGSVDAFQQQQGQWAPTIPSPAYKW